MSNNLFVAGTKVKVVSQSKYPDQKLIGLVGTVRSDCGKTIAVLFDDVKNYRSEYYYFYFKRDELVDVNKLEEKMEEKTMNAITNYLNIARVKYVNDHRTGVNQYANFDPNLRAGDLCVVKTEAGQMLVAEVVEIVEPYDVEQYREVVAKIDILAYNYRLESRAKAAELKAKMEVRAKQLQDIALYQMLAKDDPDMAALLMEYQDLPKM